MGAASSAISTMIEQALLNTHTAFFGKVISVSGNTAKVQPLNLVKATGTIAKKQSVVSAPILQSVRKYRAVQLTVSDETITTYQPTPVEAGDIVYCLCAERDITETRKGNFSVPALGHHSMSDAVVIGVV